VTESTTPRERGERAIESDDVPDTDDVKIAYIGGGSRIWARTLINDLARTPGVSGEVVLYDLDYGNARLNAWLGNHVQDRADVESDWSYAAVGDRSVALDGADFVVTSTQYDPRETFVPDLEIPKKYGIYGAVSATIGPGGIVRAMRTIPVYRDIAAAVRTHCPDAWVLNYTNPLTFVTRALYQEYPDINAVGLCHEVFGAQELLAEIVSDYFGVERPPRDAIDVDVKGINHFTWIDEATWNGHDLFPAVDWYVEQEGVVREFTPADLEDASGFVDNDQVTWELYDRFGILPAAGDRHLVEYAPWFLRGDKEALNRWGVKRTTADHRATHWDGSREETEAILEGEDTFDLSESGEVITDILRALLGRQEFVTNVNLPNRGQTSDMPEGAVVETNARFTNGSVTPLVAGELPRQVRNLVLTHVNNHETIVEAAFAGDVDLAFRAFLNDPQVLALQPETARDMFAELIATEREYFEDDWQLEESEVLDGADVQMA